MLHAIQKFFEDFTAERLLYFLPVPFLSMFIDLQSAFLGFTFIGEKINLAIFSVSEISRGILLSATG